MKKIHDYLSQNMGWYLNWHKDTGVSVMHWSLFLIIVVSFTINIIKSIDNHYLNVAQVVLSDTDSLSSTQEFSWSQYDIHYLTKEFLNLNKQFAGASKEQKPSILVELISLAKIRKEKMKTSIDEGKVSEVIQNAIPNSLKKDIPDAILPLIEEGKNLKGKFEWVHSDDFDKNISKNEFFINDESSNKKYKINFKDKDFPKSLTGERVSLKALILGDEALAQSSDLERLSSLSDTSSLAKKVLVLLINFADNTTETWTIEQVRGNMFTGSQSKNNFYKENSFGKWSLGGKVRVDGDVYGYFTIPLSFDNSCDTSTLRSQADSLASASGVNLSGYDNIMYVWGPYNSKCSFAGKAYVGGIPGISFINGYLDSRTPAHELGHNYAMYHSASMSCSSGGNPVSISDTCTTSEYGDPFEVMGSPGVLKHFHSYHKGLSGSSSYFPNWLGSANTLTLDRNTNPTGTYVLQPIEKSSTGVQTIRIPRDESGGYVSSYYYLEFRQPFGFDNFGASDPVVNGISIRLAPSYNSISTSKLVDTNPSTPSFSDAPLVPGQTFTDPYKNITITNLGVNSQEVQVKVTFGASACSPLAPSISLTPSSKNGSGGETLSYSYTIKNNDSSNCPTSTFDSNYTLPIGFVSIPEYIPSETLLPGSSVTKSFNVVSPLSSSPGQYTFGVSSKNSLDTNLAATVNATYNVVTPDMTSPSVQIMSPSNGSVLPNKGNVNISVSASDISGIANITISMDGIVLKTCTNTTSCSINYRSTKIQSGSHTITATARDKSINGNVGTVSILVSK